ncbi:hypothetical protein EFP84_04520 [Leptospira kmetyi]|uniref:Lipoprotein n=1 Tax=Leptospira kmetyi TaxID=408139 RepID=A0AAD0XPJ2_9LEPT|nr:hypothetical protein [Leptospira kmetyi]AYV54851.1 hypothetical protein EFP84_04520 [Leptospira kmetyi]TGL68586.1 hypothetical protein EHQ67_10945 [Leptospira kmetyi]
MKLIKLAVLSVILIGFVANCSTETTYVKHPTEIQVTSAQPNGSFTSLGTIVVEKQDVGFATSGPRITAAGGGNLITNESFRWVNNGTAGDVEQLLTQELVKEAKARGGNAVVKVSFGAYAVPIFIPFIGPLGLKYFMATGEVVVLGGSASTPAKTK